MSFGDFSRINTNVQALGSLRSLQNTNNQLGMRQLRLATGSRLNRAEDDTAGYGIAKKLQAKVRGQAQALGNIGDAKSMLTVAEGSLNSIMDILQNMKEKTIQAANDTLGTSERTAIKNELNALSAEVTDIIADADFNGTTLFGATGSSFSFQVNAESADTFVASIASVSAAVMSVAVADLQVSTAVSAAATLTFIDGGIQRVADAVSGVGDSQKRLTYKEQNLSVSMNNYEAARSRIADADFAREQMEIVKLQILQQTGTASLAQANSAPQAVLSLF